MNLTLEALSLAGTILAIAGVSLNNRKIRLCFILFMASNVAAMIVHLAAGLLVFAILRDWMFLILAVEGWFLWRKRGGSA
ncbi:MAG: nicotinamide mononucleotide transporter [Phycisphaerae bacterium]|nr:nicotinamide mononucleotide transporter [Phycisphaerae bacterium]